MLKSYLKKQKEEATKGGAKEKKPSKDKPENSDSEDDDDMDFKNMKVSDAGPRRRSLDESKLVGGSGGPMSPGGPGQPRQRRQSFDAGANAAMVKDALKDVNQVLGAVGGAADAKAAARPRRGSIH
jgi:hypothetical protein